MLHANVLLSPEQNKTPDGVTFQCWHENNNFSHTSAIVNCLYYVPDVRMFSIISKNMYMF